VESLVARAMAADAGADAIATRILDAALEQFSGFGFARSTVEDVARVTLYRRFAGKDALIEAVLMRECRRCLVALDEAVSALPSIEQRIVEGFRFALEFARGHPLVGGLLRVEPQVVLPFMTVHAGPATAAVRGYLAMHLRRARDAGELTAVDDVEPIAELMVRVVVSFVISPYSCIPLESDADARAFAQRYLVPLVGPRA
jgi:AcrR family transcriptional regulator